MKNTATTTLSSLAEYASRFGSNDRVILLTIALRREIELLQQIESLQAEVERLRTALEDARDDAASWERQTVEREKDCIQFAAERDVLKADVERYRWLASRRSLTLRTDGSRWKRPDGTVFVSSHYMAADGRQCEPGETLDEIVDKAKGISNE